MFLSELSADQKRVFIELGHKLALADEILSRREQALLAAMRGEMGLDPLAPPQNIELKNLELTFDTRKARMVAIVELLQIAYVDGNFDEEERTFLKGLARSFEIDDATFDKLNDWVARSFEHENAMWDMLTKG